MGMRFSLTPNTYSRVKARKKAGNDPMKIKTGRPTESNTPPLRQAPRIPINVPRVKAINKEMEPSSRVQTRPVLITWVTGAGKYE